MKSDEKERLRQILIQNCYQKKEITLTSGQKSDFYFDGKQATLHPEGISLIVKGFWELIIGSGKRVQAIGGPTLGADPIVSALGYHSYLQQNPLPAFIVRKEPKKHGTGQWIEGEKNLVPGMQVVVVEDVVTSGGSMLKAIERIESSGYSVSLALTLIDREEGGKEKISAKGYPLLSLFTKGELLK